MIQREIKGVVGRMRFGLVDRYRSVGRIGPHGRKDRHSSCVEGWSEQVRIQTSLQVPSRVACVSEGHDIVICNGRLHTQSGLERAGIAKVRIKPNYLRRCCLDPSRNSQEWIGKGHQLQEIGINFAIQ